ncbi:angiopoietin-4 isoform X4 [Calliphora vicina]|uniref:angiopoietin-4 isoform X4 n=1 Tax=Calliphora vicina TaxID=7373 RepID=UPI00325BA8B9
MKLFNKLKHLFVEVLLIVLLINLTTCHMQEAVTTAPATQQHWQRPVHTTRNTVTRWKANQSPASMPVSTTHNCDYKELITNLHDRVSLLATVDEDLRKRLDSIEKKIVQFESSNLARMDSLAVQQTDFTKRMDVTEHIQRLTRHGVDQLLELNILRKARQAEQRVQQPTSQTQSQLPQGVFMVSDSQKLDALATLLTSTRVAISGLQSQLQANVSKLMQTTGNLQRRFNNAFRRQQNQGGALVPNFYATANSPQQLTTSCAQGVLPTNGILKLQLTATSDPFYVACDEELLGGGWTLIMNRFNGDINFQRGWLEYKHGFGNLAGEFFIGLEKLYALTASNVHELLITLEDFDNKRKYARYNLFAIGNEQESYELKLLGKYEGDAGDSFSYHAGSKFSTFDNDNDGCVDCNCAQSHKGAWWYNWCDQSNLMGPYHDKDFDKIEQYRGMYWQDWLGPNYSLKSAKMMIRPLNVEQDGRR